VDRPRLSTQPRFSLRSGLDLFWIIGAPLGIIALLFALGAHT
jgi:hypothetical protein